MKIGRKIESLLSDNASLRRSGHWQSAEEPTLNVLVSLSSKARTLAMGGSSLSGWLNTATRFEGLEQQRRESRIKLRDQVYATEQINAATYDEEETLNRLLTMLDQAIDTLGPPDCEIIAADIWRDRICRCGNHRLGMSCSDRFYIANNFQPIQKPHTA
jgi:hypothetical protein